MNTETLAILAGCGAGAFVLLIMVTAFRNAMAPDQTHTIQMAQDASEYTRNQYAAHQEMEWFNLQSSAAAEESTFDGYDTPAARDFARNRFERDMRNGGEYYATEPYADRRAPAERIPGMRTDRGRGYFETDGQESLEDLRSLAEQMGWVIVPEPAPEPDRSPWPHAPRRAELPVEDERDIENTWSFRLFSPPASVPDPDYDIGIDEIDGLEPIE